ncbi:MAG: hypothetical protein KatS3mg131_2660 [Candidatus Tectimicrobiota bacterium]|nr:MAG: hypothetical protein KatS3mg131_2660 [Candidatus Tectomicrobia bacterium]
MTEGPSEARGGEGGAASPLLKRVLLPGTRGCAAREFGLSIALFRFSSVEMACKWLGQACFRAQRNAPYKEAFEVGDLQSDYDLVPDFEGEEGFYPADVEKARGKELWLRLDVIVVVMHAGMGTDLLELASRQGERVAGALIACGIYARDSYARPRGGTPAAASALPLLSCTLRLASSAPTTTTSSAWAGAFPGSSVPSWPTPPIRPSPLSATALS